MLFTSQDYFVDVPGQVCAAFDRPNVVPWRSLESRRSLVHPSGAIEGPCSVTGWSLDVPARVFGSSRRRPGGPWCIPGSRWESLWGRRVVLGHPQFKEDAAVFNRA